MHICYKYIIISIQVQNIYTLRHFLSQDRGKFIIQEIRFIFIRTIIGLRFCSIRIKQLSLRKQFRFSRRCDLNCIQH